MNATSLLDGPDSHEFAAMASASDLVGQSLIDPTCYYCAVAFLLWYDYFLTLDEEVQHMWNRPVSPASFVFYVLRYSALLSTVSECVSLRAWLAYTELSCYVFESFVMAFVVLLYTSAAIFAAMCVFAVFARNLPVAIFVLLLGLTNPAIYLVSGGRRYSTVRVDSMSVCA
ncbi:hypothetical protein BKA93DRAFT_791644 [Sparassis latifolia]